MRICIGGKNNIAVDVCSHILEYYSELDVYVIPNKCDDGKDGFQRSFKKFAKEKHVPIVYLSDVYPWADLVFFSVEFDRIIRPEKFASKQLFNIHFSILPKYKGCHTAAMPILNGEELGGVTYHLMDRGIDTGDERLFKLLLGKGANPFIKDYSGKDLFSYIEESLRVKVANWTLSDAIK